MSTIDIIMYSTGCPRCNVLEKKLTSKGISFKINNSIDEMTKLGITTVPCLMVDGKLMEFKEAVDWIGAR